MSKRDGHASGGLGESGRGVSHTRGGERT
jgi:hypothetical protein